MTKRARLSHGLFALWVASAACHSTGLEDVYFPRMPRDDPWLLAASHGTLVIDRGCLRVRGDDGRLRTVFWERPFELTTRDGRAAVRDTATGREFPVGTYVALGGGEMSVKTAESIDPVAVERCGPPFASGYIDD